MGGLAGQEPAGREGGIRSQAKRTGRRRKPNHDEGLPSGRRRRRWHARYVRGYAWRRWRRGRWSHRGGGRLRHAFSIVGSSEVEFVLPAWALVYSALKETETPFG